jgi:hypothetical protein
MSKAFDVGAGGYFHCATTLKETKVNVATPLRTAKLTEGNILVS